MSYPRVMPETFLGMPNEARPSRERGKGSSRGERPLGKMAQPTVEVLTPGSLGHRTKLRYVWGDLRKKKLIVLSPDISGQLSDLSLVRMQELSHSRSVTQFIIRVNPSLVITKKIYAFQPRGITGALNLLLTIYWGSRSSKNSEREASSTSNESSSIAKRAFRAVKHRFGGIPLLGTRKSVDDKQLSATLLTSDIGAVNMVRFPKYVHLALTNKCNLKCVMCPYHAPSLKPQQTTGYFEAHSRFDHDVLDRLLAELGRNSAQITFGQFDEPFVFKGFVGWVLKALDYGCAISITTNGTMFRPGDIEALIDAGVDHVSFSLDAARPETYSKIRGDDFTVPIENLRNLVEYRDKVGGRTTIRACLVVQEENFSEQQEFLDLMHSIGTDVASFYNLSEFQSGVWVNPVLNLDLESSFPEERYVCSQLFDQVAIYPDGNVALCCGTTMYVGYRHDVPYVGNIMKSSLKDIWQSSKYSRIRTEAFDGIFANSVCRDCVIWHNFHYESRKTIEGFREHVNAYERFVYLRESRSEILARRIKSLTGL